MGNEKPDGTKYAPEQIAATTQALCMLHKQIDLDPPKYLRIRDLKAWHFQMASPLGVLAGEWRTSAITFGSYEGLPAEQIQSEVCHTFEIANQQLELIHLLEDKDTEYKLELLVDIATYVHARLIRIHPFEDGNGRTARLVLTSMFLGAGFMPPNFEHVERKDYLAALNTYNHAGTNDMYCLKLSPLKKLILQNL